MPAVVGTPVHAAFAGATTTTLTKSVTAGNALIALIESSDGLAAVTSVKEGTATFVNDYNAPVLSGSEGIYAYRLQSAAGGASDVVTLTLPGADNGDWILYEVSGLVAAPYDSAFTGHASALSGTTLALSSAAANASASELVLVIVGDGTSSTWSLSSLSGGYTLDSTAPGTDSWGAGHLILAASAVQTTTITVSAAMAVASAVMLGYQGSGAAAGDPFPARDTPLADLNRNAAYRM